MARAAPRHVGKQREKVEDMLPLKVNLPASFEPPNSNLGYMTNTAIMQAACAPPQLTSSQWANAVNSMAPLLNAKGLRRALTILDCAIGNVQRAKALDDASAQTNAGATAAGYHCAAVCTMMQVQIHQQQQLLYHELQQLPFHEGVLRPCGQPEPFFPPQCPPMPLAHGFPWMPGLQAAGPPAPSSPTAAKHYAKHPGNLNGNDGNGNGADGDGSNGGGPPSRRRAPQTLSTSLRVLEDEDPDCLIIVRRISKLGFKATRSLKQHFSAYGQVVKVLLAHSTARQYCDQQFHVKRRPSNLGFVQMATADAVTQIVASGTSQEIEGVSICVARFERHDEEDDGLAGEEEEHVQALAESGEVAQAKLKLGKFERGMSDASTATDSGSTLTTSDDSPARR